MTAIRKFVNLLIRVKVNSLFNSAFLVLKNKISIFLILKIVVKLSRACAELVEAQSDNQLSFIKTFGSQIGYSTLSSFSAFISSNRPAAIPINIPMDNPKDIPTVLSIAVPIDSPIHIPTLIPIAV